MTDAPQPSAVIGHPAFALARWRRSSRRLSAHLHRPAASTQDIQTAFEHIRLFLDHQHGHLQELIARNDDVERFCSRCQEIIDGPGAADPDRMARERDWLLAGYRKRNAHRRPWLDRLGLRR